jgi:hypothetical protein
MSSVLSGFVRASVVLALIAVAPPAFAQTTTGSISGSVVDPQGDVVPGATVTIVHEGTGEARAATTDVDRGTFQVASLAPGTYTVRVTMQGFTTVERRASSSARATACPSGH